MELEQLLEAGHNPDSSCVKCCEKVEELHSKLIPLLSKIEEKVEAFDVEKFSGILEKLSSNSLLKMLMK